MSKITNSQIIKSRKKVIVVISALLLLTFIAVYFSFNPENSRFFPRCVFHTFTGLDCPGCGSQRAFHHLLHFEIGKAFMQNSLLVCAIPYIILGIYFEYLGGKIKYPNARQLLFGKNATIIVFVLVMLFWVGRNIIKYAL